MSENKREIDALKTLKWAMIKLSVTKKAKENLYTMDFLEIYDEKILNFEEIVLAMIFITNSSKLGYFVNHESYIKGMDAMKNLPSNQREVYERNFIANLQKNRTQGLKDFKKSIIGDIEKVQENECLLTEKEKRLIIEEAEDVLNSTPYKILGVKESNYTKEELNNILATAINNVKSTIKDEKEQEKQIDELIDAYSKILKKDNL